MAERSVFGVVETVLAVRSFDDRPLPAASVARIIEAARLTGSSMNRQPWHFIAVEERETLREMGKLATSGPYIAEAALAVVVVLEKSRFAVSDGSRAIQSMVLTAWAEGIGSNWVGFMGLEPVKPLLGIPEEMDILAIVPFGYPSRAIGAGKKKRKPRGDVVHREQFGRPFGG